MGHFYVFSAVKTYRILFLKPNPDRRQARNSAIRAEFVTLQKRHFKTDFIIGKLSTDFYLAPSTIWAIVGSTGRYRSNQATA